NLRRELDAEVYLLRDGSALVIAGYLTDPRGGGFAVDLMIAPALLDLALRRHRGRPYVLGRWLSAYFSHKFGGTAAERLRSIRLALDPPALLNRGVWSGLRLHGALGAVVQAAFVPGVALVGIVYRAPALAWIARALRALLSGMSGPAYGCGAPAEIGAVYRAEGPDATRAPDQAPADGPAPQSVLLAIAPS